MQAARLAGNLASPPWHGAARRREDDIRNREDDIRNREDDLDLQSDNTQHLVSASTKHVSMRRIRILVCVLLGH